jgi:hypothetical protein
MNAVPGTFHARSWPRMNWNTTTPMPSADRKEIATEAMR